MFSGLKQHRANQSASSANCPLNRDLAIIYLRLPFSPPVISVAPRDLDEDNPGPLSPERSRNFAIPTLECADSASTNNELFADGLDHAALMCVLAIEVKFGNATFIYVNSMLIHIHGT